MLQHLISRVFSFVLWWWWWFKDVQGFRVKRFVEPIGACTCLCLTKPSSLDEHARTQNDQQGTERRHLISFYLLVQSMMAVLSCHTPAKLLLA